MLPTLYLNLFRDDAPLPGPDIKVVFKRFSGAGPPLNGTSGSSWMDQCKFHQELDLTDGWSGLVQSISGQKQLPNTRGNRT